MNSRRFLIIVASLLFLILKDAIATSTRARKHRSTRLPVTGTGFVEDDDSNERALEIPDKSKDEKEAGHSLGPWAITAIVVASVGCIALVAIIAVAVDRQRRRFVGQSEEETALERPARFVPINDDSWRGPKPFYEQIKVPDLDDESSDEEMADDDDDVTIMEPTPGRYSVDSRMV